MPNEADDHRGRLGRLIARRRNELGLSLERAAKAAGIARQTWTGLERATQNTATYVYVSVERVLRWRPGSIEAVLAGGEPELLADTRQEPNRTGCSSEQLIRDIWADPSMDIDEKERWVAVVTRADAERAAAAAKLAAVQERLRESRELGPRAS